MYQFGHIFTLQNVNGSNRFGSLSPEWIGHTFKLFKILPLGTLTQYGILDNIYYQCSMVPDKTDASWYGSGSADWYMRPENFGIKEISDFYDRI